MSLLLRRAKILGRNLENSFKSFFRALLQIGFWVDAFEPFADLEVQERWRCGADNRDLLAALYAVAFYDRDLIDTRIYRQQVAIVADHQNRDLISVACDGGDGSVVGGHDGRAGARRNAGLGCTCRAFGPFSPTPSIRLKTPEPAADLLNWY